MFILTSSPIDFRFDKWNILFIHFKIEPDYYKMSELGKRFIDNWCGSWNRVKSNGSGYTWFWKSKSYSHMFGELDMPKSPDMAKLLIHPSVMIIDEYGNRITTIKDLPCIGTQS